LLLFSSDEEDPATAEHAKKRDGDTDISETKRKKKKKKLKSNKKKKVSDHIIIKLYIFCTSKTF